MTHQEDNVVPITRAYRMRLGRQLRALVEQETDAPLLDYLSWVLYSTARWEDGEYVFFRRGRSEVGLSQTNLEVDSAGGVVQLYRDSPVMFVLNAALQDDAGGAPTNVSTLTLKSSSTKLSWLAVAPEHRILVLRHDDRINARAVAKTPGRMLQLCLEGLIARVGPGHSGPGLERAALAGG